MLQWLTVPVGPLSSWGAKIDASDALIVAAVSSLNPKSPKVRAQMVRGYFRLSTPYLQQIAPCLALSRWQIQRRISRLTELGILEILTLPSKGGGRRRYVRPSTRLKRAMEHQRPIEKGAVSMEHPCPIPMEHQRTFKGASMPHDHCKDHYRNTPQPTPQSEPYGASTPHSQNAENGSPPTPGTDGLPNGPSPPPCANPAPYMDPEVVQGMTYLAKRFNGRDPSEPPEFPDNPNPPATQGDNGDGSP